MKTDKLMIKKNTVGRNSQQTKISFSLESKINRSFSLIRKFKGPRNSVQVRKSPIYRENTVLENLFTIELGITDRKLIENVAKFDR